MWWNMDVVEEGIAFPQSQDKDREAREARDYLQFQQMDKFSF